MNASSPTAPIIVKAPDSSSKINIAHEINRYETPLADAVINLSHELSNSFHALPITGGSSLEGSLLKNKYDEIFGMQMLRSEMTITGTYFDSFFFGNKVISEAENLAAKLYGADGTLFVTTGTTVSNQIAIDALCERNMRVLLDKSCHQSMHFALRQHGAVVDHLLPIWRCEKSGKNIWSLNDLLTLILNAQHAGAPYELIVLNAHSYDGMVYDLPQIIAYLLQNGAATRTFLIDEAWGAANYFQKDLKSLTAMRARFLFKDHPQLKIVATQSAHKSLSCLRQASMIHYCGDTELGARLKLSRFKFHTTSPSYPILASLDLARAQMQEEGEALLIRASTLSTYFCQEIKNLWHMTDNLINETMPPANPFVYAHNDPTKVSINVDELGISAYDVKDKLFLNHGIYVNRITDTSLLFNFHIGITAGATENLLRALQDIGLASEQWPSFTNSENFIISYPPGVPIIVPGDAITPEIQKYIRKMKRSGAHVFYA